MDAALALKIFTLGVKFGLHQSKLGFDPEQMGDDDVHTILQLGVDQAREEIEKCERALVTEQAHGNWYAQNWTAKQSFRFGLLTGFDECMKTSADKNGTKILTDDVIDKLTQVQFRGAKIYSEVKDDDNL